MIPVLFKAGPLVLYSYFLMLAFGLVAAYCAVAVEFRRQGYSRRCALTLTAWTALAGVAGARILAVFDSPALYLAQPLLIVLSASGFAWYGGLAGALLASYVLARRWRIPWLSIADSYAPALALAQAIAKIGCQLAGDGDWGVISTLPWAMAYPHGAVRWVGLNVKALDGFGRLVQPFHSWMPVPPGVRVHPAPIYETILYLGVFAALWSLRKKIRARGRIFYLYLILAGASRFIVEFIRMNPRVAWGLTQPQLIAFGMAAIGLAAYSASAVMERLVGAEAAASPP